MKKIQDDKFLHGKQSDSKQGDDHQLHRADFTQDGSVGDQRAGAAEIRIYQTAKKKKNQFKFSL